MARRAFFTGIDMKLSAELTQLSTRLGYKFAQPELLVRAVTHSSMSSANRDDNQRLEFLGDRVLGLVIAEALLAADKDASEGLIAPRFNALVRRETCAEIARKLDIGLALKLGRSEMQSGGRRKEALLADAMEAVIAAVFMDGGFEAAQTFILGLWKPLIETVEDDARDPKTSLQEWAQARGEQPPKYVELSRSGPDHQPIFTIEVQLASGPSEHAIAGSKRHAEQAAAKALLEKVST